LLLLLPVAIALWVALAAPALAQEYSFTKVADSVTDGFDPFGFGGVSINTAGDVAFRAARFDADGFNTIGGIYRFNSAEGDTSTIVENRKKYPFVGFFPSMNDSGQVSFAARLRPDKKTFESPEVIFRGDGKKLTEIAATADEFAFFGFDTSINNGGEVAFKAELDQNSAGEFPEGLFSGDGDVISTHHLNTADIQLDGAPARFGGNDTRPSINDLGNIAFDESVQPGFDPGIFLGQLGTFATIFAPNGDFVEGPNLNDAGTVAFKRSFFDSVGGQFVIEIRTASGGAAAVVADTRGPFSEFGFRPPALNDNGQVAFHATLDDFSMGIFTGPDTVNDKVVATGDSLDGDTVDSLAFYEEGLNDSGELAFWAQFQDDFTLETRTAVFVATPVP
jgi:hypothetical protein